MQVIPAVDVLGDETVRLVEGDYDRVSVRAGDPADAARRFGAAGARLVHLVDLEGARSGRPRPELVARVAAAVPVQASGGIRSLADADALLRAGADRVVVGTAAFARPDSVARLAGALGERLVVALDVRAGRVRVGGWLADAGLDVDDALARCLDAGAARVLCTAIERDGTLAGPDLGLLRRVAAAGLPVLAAGGIATEADLEAVAAAGCEGAIVGRALLDGSLPLRVLAGRVGPL